MFIVTYDDTKYMIATYLKLKSGDAQRIATLGIGGTIRIARAT